MRSALFSFYPETGIQLMKNLSYLTIITLLFTSPFVVSRTTEDLSAMDLAVKIYHRPNGDDSIQTGKMILIDKGHKPRIRVSTTYTQDKIPGEVKTLIRFSKPTEVKHTSLLGIDKVGKNNTQWLFLPALKRVRKISADRKNGKFVGSDIYYQDMQDRNPNEDNHKLLGTQKIKGVSCQLLQSTPKPGSNYLYSKRIACIHLKSLLPLNAEFYINDELVKTWKTVKLKKIQGFWTITESLITATESGHITRLITEKISYNQGLPDSLFSQQILEDPGSEQQFISKN